MYVLFIPAEFATLKTTLKAGPRGIFLAPKTPTPQTRNPKPVALDPKP